MPIRSLAFAILLTACVHETETEQPFSLTPITVDPVTEANDVERALREAGFVVRDRVDARGVVAIAAELPPSAATAVRIVTRLGTVLGVDAPDHSAPFRTRVSLVTPWSGRDLDGDGTIEILLRLLDESMGDCVAVVRVQSDGRAFELPLPTGDFGATACAADVRDVLGDARPELLVRHTAPAVGVRRVPTVLVPFVGTEGMWSEADRSLVAPFYTRQREERAALLAIATRAGDAENVAQLEAEIILLDALLAREAAAQ